MNSVSISEHHTHGQDRLDELFHQFQTLKSSDRATAVSDFQEFKSGLERRILGDKEIVFPAFEKRSGYLGGPTQVMRWEHRKIWKYLGALAAKLARNEDDTGGGRAGIARGALPAQPKGRKHSLSHDRPGHGPGGRRGDFCPDGPGMNLQELFSNHGSTEGRI